jgi:hypothetical protein
MAQSDDSAAWAASSPPGHRTARPWHGRSARERSAGASPDQRYRPTQRAKSTAKCAGFSQATASARSGSGAVRGPGAASAQRKAAAATGAVTPKAAWRKPSVKDTRLC